MMNNELILDNVYDEDVSINYSTYFITFKDFHIQALRTRKFSNDVGEMEDEIIIEKTEKILTDEDKEIIKNFIWEQD